jgi:uncharacterized membrane protein HdeD (DUF308 family)
MLAKYGTSRKKGKVMADVAQPQPMLAGVANRLWWALLLRGIAAVLFGMAALFWPGKTLWVLIVFFGAYALVGGIFTIAAGIMDSARRWLLIVEGILGVVAGLIGLYTLILGIASIVLSFRVRGHGATSRVS